MTTGNRVGYARVSSLSQNLESQVKLLKSNGCSKVFTDKFTGSKLGRPGWDELMDYIRKDDKIVITELSRLTRSLLDFLKISKELSEKDIQIISLRENIDSSSSMGKCFMSMMASVYEMENQLRSERAHAGRESARAQGKTGGRPRTSPEKLESTRILYENSNKSIAQVCKEIGVGKRTFFSYLKNLKEKQSVV